ncbi:hypothetical protein [Anaplasma platys]|nr:hypothetical protein [Anaplasma platys]
MSGQASPSVANFVLVILIVADGSVAKGRVLFVEKKSLDRLQEYGR